MTWLQRINVNAIDVNPSVKCGDLSANTCRNGERLCQNCLMGI